MGQVLAGKGKTVYGLGEVIFVVFLSEVNKLLLVGHLKQLKFIEELLGSLVVVAWLASLL